MASSQITRFFVDAFASALELGIATPEDVLKHATPAVLSQALPRPIWARLIAACLAAPRTDAKLVVDTIGVPDLCEHVPAPILWGCLAEIAQRALGKSLLAMAPAPSPAVPEKIERAPSEKLAQGTSPGVPVAAAPIAPVSSTGSQPVAAHVPTHVPTRAQTEPPAPLGELPPVGSRAPTGGKPSGPPQRPSGAIPAVSTSAPTPPSGGNGLRTTQAGASTRRPQAAAAPAVSVPEGGRERKGPRTAPPSGRRTVTTNSDFELDTDVNEWKQGQQTVSKPEALVVEDDLVDWAQSEDTSTGGVDLERKR
jgi:hypothetical protein